MNTVSGYLTQARRAGYLPPIQVTAQYAVLLPFLKDKQDGETDADLAARAGVSVLAIRRARSRATANGLLERPPPPPPPPPAPPRPPGQPLNRYHALRAKGAAPPLGSMGALIEKLPTAAVTRLLRATTVNDATLADTICRLALERLNGVTDPRG